MMEVRYGGKGSMCDGGGVMGERAGDRGEGSMVLGRGDGGEGSMVLGEG